jgi:hypothetical protein
MRELLRNEIYPRKKRVSGWFYKRHSDIQFANNAAAGIADKPGHQMRGFPCLPSISVLIFEFSFFYYYSAGLFVLMLIRLPKVKQGVKFGNICRNIPSCAAKLGVFIVRKIYFQT